jgi:soluble cytochrome b562
MAGAAGPGIQTEIRDMSEKQEIIQKMLEMQKKFIAYEHAQGVDPKDYFNPTEEHELAGYRQEYQELATRLVDMAHAEKGSKR